MLRFNKCIGFELISLETSMSVVKNVQLNSNFRTCNDKYRDIFTYVLKDEIFLGRLSSFLVIDLVHWLRYRRLQDRLFLRESARRLRKLKLTT